jgi:hypothetical protein
MRTRGSRGQLLGGRTLTWSDLCPRPKRVGVDYLGAPRKQSPYACVVCGVEFYAFAFAKYCCDACKWAKWDKDAESKAKVRRNRLCK